MAHPSPPGRRLPAALLVAVLLASAAPDPAVAARREGRWFTVRTGNFTVLTNGRKQTASLVARNMEALRNVVLRDNPGLTPRFSVPTYVLAFKDWDSFRPYQRTPDGKSLQVDGLFNPHPFANYIVLDANLNSDPFPRIYHEYMHFLLRTLFSDVPLWLGEGLAEYYSSLWMFPDRAEIGGRIKHHVETLSEGALMPLDELFAVSHQSPVYGEDSRRGLFYAQSWAMVHALLGDDPTRLDGMRRFVERVQAGESQRTALAALAGVPEAQLEQALVVRLRQERFRSVRLAEARIESFDEEAVETASPADVEAHLGFFLTLADLGRASLRDRHLKTALELQPFHPLAMAGLAFRRLMDGQVHRAVATCEKALEHQPDAEMPTLVLSQALLQRHLDGMTGEGFSFGSGDAAGPPAEVLRARELLRKLIAARPNRAETLVAFGYTFVQDPAGVREGIEALERARALLPHRGDITLNLAILYLHAGNTERGITLLRDAGASSGDPDVVSRAQTALVLTRFQTVELLLAAGRMDEALELLSEMKTATTDAPTLELIQRRLRKVEKVRALHARLKEAEALLADGHLEEGADILRALRGTVEEESAIDFIDEQLLRIGVAQARGAEIERYNEALGMARRGELDEARQSLEGLLDDALHVDVRSAAEELLTEIRQRLDSARLN